MAGITIKGDTSGEITLNVPATAGTNTITIPASSGTLAVQDGSGDLAVTNDLSVGGNISTPTGTVTASSFSGDGSSLTGIAGGFSNMEVFTSPGTWTNPGNVEKVKVTVTGGGGSGVNQNNNTGSIISGGGGGGGTAIEIIPFPSATNVPVTVGAAAGTSSFGPYCSATGGSNGTVGVANPGAGGAGGVGSGGTINFSGSDGGVSFPSNPSWVTGYGGNSYLGGGGQGAQGPLPAGAASTPGNSYGGGGGGAGRGKPSPTAAVWTITAGSGASGVVIVEF